MTTDSRKVGKGSLYIAIRGGSADGHDFIAEAADNGAAAAVAESSWMKDNPDPGIPVIAAENTRRAASRLFAAWYCGEGWDAGAVNTRLVAVTGTNGKTTVAHMISHILSYAGYKTGLIGTVGASLGGKNQPDARTYKSRYTMTTPPPEEFYDVICDMIRSGAEYIVFEASSHGIAQERLSGLDVTGAELAAAVFTNLTPEHMDYHAGMEDYFAVKCRLFTEYDPEIKIINTSDGYGERLFSMCGGRKISVKTAGGGGDSVYPHGVMMLGAAGVEYMYSSPGAIFPINCPVPGRYTVYNSIEAAAAALSLGVDPVTVRDALSSFRGVRGRMERVRCDTTKFSPHVFIDFAHTPAALSGLLKSLREAEPSGRLVLVFGCGGDRDRTKRAVMGKIAGESADLTIITSDNSRTERAEDIIAEILRGVPAGADFKVITDRTEAINYAIMNATARDVIVLAGKGHENYEDSGGVRRRFDEREVVAAAIEERYSRLGGI